MSQRRWPVAILSMGVVTCGSVVPAGNATSSVVSAVAPLSSASSASFWAHCFSISTAAAPVTAAPGIPAAPVPTDFRGAFFTDPHADFHGYAVRYQHPDFGAIEQVGTLLHAASGPRAAGHIAPALGQHTAEILSDLGYSAAEIRDLEERRIIGQAAISSHEGTPEPT